MNLQHSTCPGCGSRVTIAGRDYCRPSCKARHEYLARRRDPVLFSTMKLESEWPGQHNRSVNTSAIHPSLWRAWACERDDLLFDPRLRGDEEGTPPCRGGHREPNSTTISDPKPVRESCFASEKVT